MNDLRPHHAPLLGLGAATALGCSVAAGQPWMWLLATTLCVLAVRMAPLPQTLRYLGWLLAFVLAGASMRTAAEQRADEIASQVAAHVRLPNARFEATVERVLLEFPYARVRVHLHALRRMDATVPVDVRAVINLPAGLRPPSFATSTVR